MNIYIGEKMSEDNPKFKLVEKIQVKKFMGDDQTQEPFEIVEIEVEDGVVISSKVIQKGDTNGTN